MSSDLRNLSPDAGTKAVLEMVERSGAPPMHEMTTEDARLAMRAGGEYLDIEPPQVDRVEDRTVPGPGGDLPIRIYHPYGANGKVPVLLYFHGGGFVIGDLDTHDTICRTLCLAGESIVVSVDYRLAPEHRYPAAVDDALAAFEWLSANAADIGGDPSRLAVGGDSAGGTLAAVVALHARDSKKPPLLAQLLFYPVVDHGAHYASYDEHAETYPISKPVLAWFWEQYFGGDANATRDSRLHMWSSPMRAESHTDLAPAFVLTAGLDPLRDEGAAYATRLSAAGVDTTYQCAMGAVHGFLRMGKLVPATGEALASGGAFLKSRVHG